MSITVWLVRHGETDWNKEGRIQGLSDTHLNANGLEQARLCGQFFQGKCFDRIDAIVSSPLKRAYETATIIAKYTRLQDVHVLDRFKERDFGSLSGLTKEERLKQFPNGEPVDVESREQLQQRVREALYELTAQFSNQQLIVVSHGAFINCLLHVLSNGTIGTGKTVLHNGSVSTIVYKHGEWQIQDYNQMNHLYGSIEGSINRSGA